MSEEPIHVPLDDSAYDVLQSAVMAGAPLILFGRKYVPAENWVYLPPG